MVLIVNRSMKPGQNLQVLRLMHVLAILSDLGPRRLPLLLRLADSDPILGGEMFAKFSEDVRGHSQSCQQRTVLQRVQNNMIVGPGKVQDPEAVDMRLVLRWCVHAMDYNI